RRVLFRSSSQISEQRMDDENGGIITYEKLVNNPRKTMIELGEFMGLDYSAVDFNKREKVLKNARVNDEKWKDGVVQMIKNRNNKFETYFSAEEQEYICANLLNNPFYEFQLPASLQVG